MSSSASSFGDYYHRLRLHKNASRQEIKAAYRRLSRQYHPELHPHQPGMATRFYALKEAYEVLSDRVQRQRYDQCQHDSQHKIPRQPQTPCDYYLRGVNYTLAHRYRAAISDYTQAVKLDPQFAEAYLRRAQVHYLIKDDPSTLSDCQQAIALNSTEAKTYYYQGMARYRLDYVQSAIAAFTDAITCDPEDAEYYYRRGLAYQDLHELHRAARDFRRAARRSRLQGDVANYQRLQLHLKQFGTAGRSRPIQFLGSLAGKLSQHTSSTPPPTQSPPSSRPHPPSPPS
ncbi:MAG: DnaJ domain-containing protein, partial [Phormidesmis sp.]